MGKSPNIAASALRGRLDVIAREYYAPLLAFFRKRTRNAAEVEDLVQQVFFRLSQHQETGGSENVDAYIFKTASNALRDHRRREEVRGRYIEGSWDQRGDLQERDADFPSDRVLISREAMKVVAATLRELPDRTRDVFMLRCFEGLKLTDIARLQNISVRAVEKHIAKVTALLSRRLERT